jgi:DNA repair ATPase RecN
MTRHNTLIGAALALALATGACNRDAKDTRKDAIKEDAKVADAAAAVEKERNDEIARLNDRVAQVERDYSAKAAVLASGRRTATSSLREEVQEDVNNVKQAVANLSTTTADNWWQREEDAMRATIDDVAADVKRLGGRISEPAPAAPGETAATAPFTSRRDAFVA